MRHKTAKLRVLQLLEFAMKIHDQGRKQFTACDGDVMVYLYDGYIPQSVMCNPAIVWSTEGKRLFRYLRADPEMQKKYVFEVKRFSGDNGIRWGYRIRKREEVSRE